MVVVIMSIDDFGNERPTPFGHDASDGSVNVQILIQLLVQLGNLYSKRSIRRLLARDHSAVAHQLPRIAESGQRSDFGHDTDGDDLAHASQGLKRLNHLFWIVETPLEGQAADITKLKELRDAL